MNGTYTLYVRAVRHEKISSLCCDTFNCDCDNKFFFCLRPYGSSQDDNTGHCPLGSVKTGELADDTFNFRTPIQSGISNPMSFPGSVWPVSMCSVSNYLLVFFLLFIVTFKK